MAYHADSKITAIYSCGFSRVKLLEVSCLETAAQDVCSIFVQVWPGLAVRDARAQFPISEHY